MALGEKQLEVEYNLTYRTAFLWVLQLFMFPEGHFSATIVACKVPNNVRLVNVS